ncbi:DUF6585 family protein [Pantanalinema rosaneae CENA516]|uniref:DUF6585 family protein n=1 Tax=Pantanalinema rosaneae TaxID=1620701 RepID=UPI003D6F1E4D
MDIQQVAQANRFGALIDRHPAQSGLYVIGTIVSLILGGILMLFCSVGMPLGNGWTLNGGIYALALSLFFLIAACYFSVMAIAALGINLYLFQHGLIYCSFGKRRIIPYDEITVIWQGQVPSEQHEENPTSEERYVIETADGDRLILGQMFANLQQIGDYLQQEFVHRQLPQVLNAYRWGRSIHFGLFSISRTGLTTTSGILAWTDLKAVTLQNGMFSFMGNTGRSLEWLNVSIANIPNVGLFLALVQHILQSREGAGMVVSDT